MNKRLSKILSICTLCICLIVFMTNETIIAYADTSNNGWTEMEEATNISTHKAWTIDFSKGVSFEDIGGIVVTKDNKFIPVEIEVNKNKVTVNTVTPYEGNAKYVLKVFLQNGKRYSKSFTTSSIEEEEPEAYMKDRIDGKILRISPNPKKGYNYPYLLYIPNKASQNKNSRLLVEPNNTGIVSDDLLVHEKGAKRLINGSYGWNTSHELNIPYLVPVLPRPETNYVYTHELTRNTMLVKNSPMSRLDNQLVAMIEDAQELLKKRENIIVPDKTLMIGYSASSKFTNRFAIMHPEYVRALAVGGINSIPTFPTDKVEGRTLRYPVGIADLKDITGITFNMNEYKKVSQYIYMGENDTNDDTLFNDAYEKQDQDLIHSLIGRKMLPDRYNKTQAIFKSLEIPVQFVTYKGIGHGTNQYTTSDVLKFFKANYNDSNGFKTIVPHQ